jgi:4-amino-4-deoxy-L-arabinose transferase-like glycosyltransferase
MTKGPITPMVAGLTALSLSLVTRRWRWLLDLKPLVGIVILVAIVAPWVYGVTRVLEDPALQLRMGIPLPAPGEPAKLVWEVPKEFEALPATFTFKDVPLQ